MHTQTYSTEGKRSTRLDSILDVGSTNQYQINFRFPPPPQYFSFKPNPFTLLPAKALKRNRNHKTLQCYAGVNGPIKQYTHTGIQAAKIYIKRGGEIKKNSSMETSVPLYIFYKSDE